MTFLEQAAVTLWFLLHVVLMIINMLLMYLARDMFGFVFFWVLHMFSILQAGAAGRLLWRSINNVNR